MLLVSGRPGKTSALNQVTKAQIVEARTAGKVAYGNEAFALQAAMQVWRRTGLWCNTYAVRHTFRTLWYVTSRRDDENKTDHRARKALAMAA